MRETIRACATAARLAGLASLVGLTAVGAGPAAAQDATVGALSELAAWVNRMPGPGAAGRLHVIGSVTAPTPCYDAVAEFAGETASLPPVYRVKVTLVAQEGVCIAMLRDIEFHYIAEDYRGTSVVVNVMTDQATATVPVETVF